ncbi:MAG: beta-phosphoglucomutase [Anaerolineae bacterium]|nr:beta-phosphoglucomutase [Anaerolineae bacterium]
MKTIRALIFDLDGVITDTAEYHYLAWKRLADEEGIPFTREDNEALRGVSRRGSLDRMLKGRPIDEETAQAWMTRKNHYYVGYLDKITPADLLPGVQQLLDEAKRLGLLVSIGSASKNAKLVLNKLGLGAAFDAIGDGYSVVNTKPAPDLFIWVAGRLDVYPPQAIVIEDAEAGIDAARQGGFLTVGIGASTANCADIHYDDVASIVLVDVLNRLAAD